jgi:hypothetical protein
VRAEVYSSLQNDWLGVQGDLVEQETGEVMSFYEELEFFSGTDSEGSWSEGRSNATEYISSVSPGRYVLRTTAAFAAKPNTRRSYRVVLTSDTPRGMWFGCALVLLLLGPLFAHLRTSSFESSRWAESNLGSDDE